MFKNRSKEDNVFLLNVLYFIFTIVWSVSWVVQCALKLEYYSAIHGFAVGFFLGFFLLFWTGGLIGAIATRREKVCEQKDEAETGEKK